MRLEDNQILNQISEYWYPEGHLNFDQRDFFTNTLKILKPKSCLEIGFASGRSAVTTLVAAQPEILVSVDLSLDYTAGAGAHAEFLQREFLNLKIVEGDSRQVLNGKFFESISCLEYYTAGPGLSLSQPNVAWST